ncbi:MAG: ribose transport system substrate-binding protein [Chloroflexota bacterium]|jgi:ribose transport system substrate-binding protein|nr:ribose transport system substrate-binding protein [Chloroflexota bacterium]
MTRFEQGHRGWRPAALLPALVLIVSACSGTAATQAPSEAASTAPSAAPSAEASAAAPSASTAGSTVDELIAASGVTSDTSFCGSKPMKLGISDGGGINGWSAASYAAVRSEAAKCSNVTQVATAASFSIEKQLADINSFVAQKFDAIVIIPDAGDTLAALQAAHTAGLVVVPWASDPGGKPGTDYNNYVDWDTTDAGKTWADWMVKALNGTGNVVFLGGFAGSAVGHQELDGINSVFGQNSGIKLLTGTTDFVPTNWDQATAQQAMTTLLNQYPQIDGVISNYDADAVGIIRAFQAANRPLVPLTTLDSNKLGCDFAGLKAANPKFEMVTISSRNWLGRIAARKAIAAVQGLPETEPDSYKLPIFEDSLGGLAPQCDSAQGPDVFLSNKISADDLAKWGKVTD